MTTVAKVVDRIRGIDIERLAGLRPHYPPVAIEIDESGIVLVRLRRKRRSKPTLELHQVRELGGENLAPGNMLRPNLASIQQLSSEFKAVLSAGGIKAGRVSLILPDNLAKISLIELPERPASRAQFEELLRFKIRRSVPFRLQEAVMSYQLIDERAGSVRVLVALMRRLVVEQYEKALARAGVRVGMIDLCTPNVLNLYRAQIEEACKRGDVALLNATPSYFSLVLVRRETPIFFRCKSYKLGSATHQAVNGMMIRELSTSLSYYEDKLDGKGIDTVFVRSLGEPLSAFDEPLGKLGVRRVAAVDPASALNLLPGLRLDEQVGQRIAPAVGAASGRV